MLNTSHVKGNILHPARSILVAAVSVSGYILAGIVIYNFIPILSAPFFAFSGSVIFSALVIKTEGTYNMFILNVSEERIKKTAEWCSKAEKISFLCSLILCHSFFSYAMGAAVAAGFFNAVVIEIEHYRCVLEAQTNERQLNDSNENAEVYIAIRSDF